MARQRFRAAEWAGFIDEWNASGLVLAEFCRRHGLNQGTMQGWVYKPALKRAIEKARRDGQVKEAKPSQEDAPSIPSPAFLPVRFADVTAPSPEPTDRAAIEVVVGAGRRIVVGPGFHPETLRRVVAALEG
jgi:hypothetical protein